uniref:Ubiquitin-like protease family profile domain-containing protein n=1 Tax=Cannabis sativa TaxID=3483 RepID=A0A803PI40_CANSA
MPPKLIVPFPEHFTDRVTYRGSGIFSLNFTKGPTDDEKEAMLGFNRLINLYFNRLDNMKTELLQNKFLACETLVVMKGLHPRPDEEAYVRTITYNGAEVLVEMGVDETQPPKTEGWLGPYDGAALQNRPADPTPEPSMEEDADVYSTVMILLLMIHLVLLWMPPSFPYMTASLKFGKRKRVPPTWFNDYAEMKKKARPSSASFDPLSPPDERLLDSFRRWLCGAIPNHCLRDVKTDDYGPSWFFRLLSLREWIQDSHIDACAHMIRRRRYFFSNTFCQRGIVLSTYVADIMHGVWNAHKGPRADFIWGDEILMYCKGVQTKFYPKWEGNDFLYFVLNLREQRHWIAVEVDIELWKIIVYNCDSTICSKIDLKDNSQIPIMQYTRASHNIFPKAKTSGGCGVYAIESVHHLMMQHPLVDVCDSNLRTFWEQWCVDLFYKNLS